MNYDTQPTLHILGNSVIEVMEEKETEDEKAARELDEEFGGSITETLYARAMEQRDERIEDDYFTQRG